jgi:polyferredoxin
MKRAGWIRRQVQVVDESRRIRNTFQVVFLFLNIWIGVHFFLFVRHFEQPSPRFSRPAGVEGWLPIAGMMNSWYWLQTGEIPSIHPAAMVLFLTFLFLSILFRKAFCGWLCPIGTVSERLWKLGGQTFRRSFFPPRWLDIGLRGLKYLLLALFVWAVGSMTPGAIREFLDSPYGQIADVKMLNFFRHMSVTSAVVIAILCLGSIFVPNLWCRYLCPYGALMGLASLASVLRIRRRPDRCIDCAKCAKACPSNLPVDKLVQIRSAECLGCMECVAVCPAEGALFMGIGPRRPIGPRVFAAAVAAGFLLAVGVAQVTGHWDSPIPDETFRALIPSAAKLRHP